MLCNNKVWCIMKLKWWPDSHFLTHPAFIACGVVLQVIYETVRMRKNQVPCPVILTYISLHQSWLSMLYVVRCSSAFTAVSCCMQAVQASIGQFGTGSSQQQIWLDDVNCTSSHQLLSECGNRGWGRHNCHHWEDVGVICEGVRV